MTNFVKFVDDDDDNRGLLRDHETRSHPMMFADAVDPIKLALDATEAFLVKDAALLSQTRRPGFYRAGDAVDSRAAARAASRQRTYNAYDKEISTAWMGKAAPVANHAAVDTSTYDAVTAKTRKDAALDAYDLELTNSWKKTGQF